MLLKYAGVLVIAFGIYDMFISTLVRYGTIAASPRDFAARIGGLTFYCLIAFVLIRLGQKTERKG